MNNSDNLVPKGAFLIKCHDKNGLLKWVERIDNLVVNTGKDYMLESNFGATQLSFFIGFTSGTPTIAATDTALAHPGWSEVDNYSQLTRPAFTPNANAIAQTISNSDASATFSISGAVEIGGLFLQSDSAKSSTAGLLFSAAAFATGNRTPSIGDTLNVVYTLSLP